MEKAHPYYVQILKTAPPGTMTEDEAWRLTIAKSKPHGWHARIHKDVRVGRMLSLTISHEADQLPLEPFLNQALVSDAIQL